eukprot:428055-Amphidinium_carterae.1
MDIRCLSDGGVGIRVKHFGRHRAFIRRARDEKRALTCQHSSRTSHVSSRHGYINTEGATGTNHLNHPDSERTSEAAPLKQKLLRRCTRHPILNFFPLQLDRLLHDAQWTRWRIFFMDGLS